MTKNIKKCYETLNLRLDANENEVKVRQKVMIKVLRAKTFRTGKSNQKKIDKINSCANLILENIKTNGVGKNKILFDTSFESIATTLLVLIIMLTAIGVILKVML